MSLPLWHVTAGFLVTLVLGLGARPYIRWTGRSIPVELPPGVSEEHRCQWRDLTAGSEGGAFMGRIERFMFFAAFLADASLMIGAWLAFKVASKWNAWTNITAVPRQVEGIADLDFAIGRRRWASHVLMTFLVGTAYNICAGLLGAAVARNFEQLSKLIGY
jgi:hypothetical protein